MQSRAGCEALIAEFRKRENKLHVLVNNSGITWGGPFLDFPEEKGWDNVFNVNVKSIFYSALSLLFFFGLLVGLTMCFLFLSLVTAGYVLPGHESQYALGS
jgi:hypothetical protein